MSIFLYIAALLFGLLTILLIRRHHNTSDAVQLVCAIASGALTSLFLFLINPTLFFVGLIATSTWLSRRDPPPFPHARNVVVLCCMVSLVFALVRLSTQSSDVSNKRHTNNRKAAMEHQFNRFQELGTMLAPKLNGDHLLLVHSTRQTEQKAVMALTQTLRKHVALETAPLSKPYLRPAQMSQLMSEHRDCTVIVTTVSPVGPLPAWQSVVETNPQFILIGEQTEQTNTLLRNGVLSLIATVEQTVDSEHTTEPFKLINSNNAPEVVASGLTDAFVPLEAPASNLPVKYRAHH